VKAGGFARRLFLGLLHHAQPESLFQPLDRAGNVSSVQHRYQSIDGLFRITSAPRLDMARDDDTGLFERIDEDLLTVIG
jgi:hypothetical protein